jgi:hypothetical protein
MDDLTKIKSVLVEIGCEKYFQEFVDDQGVVGVVDLQQKISRPAPNLFLRAIRVVQFVSILLLLHFFLRSQLTVERKKRVHTATHALSRRWVKSRRSS